MSTQIPSVDLVTKVLTRLQGFHSEIEGVKSVYLTAPLNQLDLSLLPAVYHLVGPMVEPVPNTGNESGGSVIIARRFVARLLVRPIGLGDDQGTNGAYASQGALPLFSAFAWRYLTRPRLSLEGVTGKTVETDPLSGLSRDIQFTDSGLQQRPGPGGVDYHAIDFTLTVAMRLTYELEEY